MKKINDQNWKKFFIDLAEQSGLILTDNQAVQFEKYLVLLEEWNRKINITAIKNRKQVVIKHFLDSLLMLNYVSLSGKIADIGSGGGFPGIPLKIFFPELDVVLMEPVRKKASFLQTVIYGLNLKKISVFNNRAEDFPEKNFFDFTLSRAVSTLNRFCEISLPILKSGGFMVALKGKETASEEEALKIFEKQIRCVEKKCFNLPLNSGRRSIIVLQKCFT